jgi:hypothetical protein
MAEGEPRLQVETCLTELQRELAGLGVPATMTRDRAGRACLDARDRWGRSLRVHVYVQFFWFVWGAEPDRRHSVFRVGEAAARLARMALGQGWPYLDDEDDLARALGHFPG